MFFLQNHSAYSRLNVLGGIITAYLRVKDYIVKAIKFNIIANYVLTWGGLSGVGSKGGWGGGSSATASSFR